MIVAPSTERCANLTLNQSIEAHQHISLWTGRPEIEKAGNEMDKNAAEVQCGKEKKAPSTRQIRIYFEEENADGTTKNN